jgi:hypothetical protein
MMPGARLRSIRQPASAVPDAPGRQRTHDAQVYRSYLQAAERLHERGATVQRVVLETALKRDYQRFLQERNRGKSDSDGHPDRTREEIHHWAKEHHLPEHDGHVQFPDARIDSELPPTAWHAAIGEPSIADAICDRLIQHAHRLTLKGPTMRDPGTRRGTKAPA